MMEVTNVYIYGGVGPLHSDVSLTGVAKAFGVRLAPDEEFQEYLSHLIGYQCTGDRNELAQLPEGITELLHHEKLPVPLIKCQNVIILTATNVTELDEQWDCLIELTKSTGLLVLTGPFVSKRLATDLSDVGTANSISKLRLDFPDLYIGPSKNTISCRSAVQEVQCRGILRNQLRLFKVLPQGASETQGEQHQPLPNSYMHGARNTLSTWIWSA